MSHEKVQRALSAIREGRMVILVDDEDRENEGDLCCAADKITPELINFMASKIQIVWPTFTLFPTSTNGASPGAAAL